jgi:hypothetical protein
MKRWSLIATVFFASLAAVAQQTPDRPPLSSDLVLWSYMQQPQQPEQDQSRQAPTTPDPHPETQPAQNPTPSQPSQPSKGPSAPAQSQSQAAQTFTGIISKQSDNFLLKVSETISYKLDNQQEVQQYEGKRVRVTGTLDSSINLIHVDKVEPLT